MADRTSTPRSSDAAVARPTVVFTTADNGPTPGRETNPVSSLLRRLQDHAPHSTQLVGIMAFVVTGTVLLLLTGITVTVTFVGLIFFAPLIIVSSPIWFPVAAVFFFVAAGFLLLSGFGLAAVAVLSWIYKYFSGMRPPGSGRVDDARSRIYDTASHVKDYAREYGGYLKSKVKDAAPGA